MSGAPIPSLPTRYWPPSEELAEPRLRSASEMKRGLLLLGALLASGCGQFPKDPDGTLMHVRAEHVFRVGIIAPGPGPGRLARERVEAFLDGVAEETSARPTFSIGAAEPLLAKLEEGRLDLVIGALTSSSPWTTRVAMMPPLHEQVAAGEHYLLTPMAKNGENAWIMLLESEARDAVAGRPGM